MAITYQLLLGRFYQAASAAAFTVDSNDINIAAGWYYPWGYSGESSDQFLDHLQTLIRAIGAPFTTATVTCAVATGLVTIDTNAGSSKDITWSDTDVRDLLGFTGNLTGAESYTATNQMRYVWRPTKALSYTSVDRDEIWAPDSSSRVLRSSGGTAYSVVGYTAYDVELSWQYLPKADVITDSSTVWESLQQFWVDVIAKGSPLRYLPDRTSYTSTSFGCGLVMGDETIGSFEDMVRRNIDGVDTRWGASVQVAKYE